MKTSLRALLGNIIVIATFVILLLLVRMAANLQSKLSLMPPDWAPRSGWALKRRLDELDDQSGCEDSTLI